MQVRRSQVWCSLSSRKRKSDQRWLLAVAIVSVTKFFLSDTYSIIRRLLIHTFRFSRCNRALHKRCNGKNISLTVRKRSNSVNSNSLSVIGFLGRLFAIKFCPKGCSLYKVYIYVSGMLIHHSLLPREEVLPREQARKQA